MKKLQINAASFINGDKSLKLSYPHAAHTGLEVSCTTVGDLKWIVLPLPLHKGDVVKEVSIHYRVSNPRSFISQIRLTDQESPDVAVVLHDDGTDLLATVPTTYRSLVADVVVKNSMLLALRLKFGHKSDVVKIGGVEILYDESEGLPEQFVVHSNLASFIAPEIVVQYGQDPELPARMAGFNWADIYRGETPSPNYTEETSVVASVLFLQEAIQKMTGRNLHVVSKADISQGIVLTTLRATPSLARIPEIRQALLHTGNDAYETNEAFYIRSYAERLLIVANTADGLAAAIPALLESVGYEVLGMGPNWTHVPKNYREALAFTINSSDRPAYYFRKQWATSGQNYGVGTLTSYYGLVQPDEPVDKSYLRWYTGTRMLGASMPPYPGHALQGYHRPVVQYMKTHGLTDGFLCRAQLGLESNRPAPTAATDGLLWINADVEGEAKDKVYLSNGTGWVAQDLEQLAVNLDLSVLFVREIILEHLKTYANEHFEKYPNAILSYCNEPEDGGGYLRFSESRHKNWYPDYLAARGLPFGRPYALHGFYDLNQPLEIWDENAVSDTVFAFDNWLLQELDRWIDSLPAAQQNTITNKPKKSLLRLVHYSYGFHDVPPNFNIDRRLRIMIAGYPKNRGVGKWVRFGSRIDMGLAFRKLIPTEYPAHYEYLSMSASSDYSLSMLPPLWSSSAKSIFDRFNPYREAGFKALSAEADFNFGKYGLGYYLIAKFLWKPTGNAAELDSIRDHWLQLAFGSVWQKMKAYYDFMLPENFTVNAPRFWATAVRLIDEADRSFNHSLEPEVKKRIDDVKQFWYYYYLVHTNKNTKDDPDMRTFIWKGQMSYMTAMYMIYKLIFEKTWVSEVFGTSLNGTPAHYSATETQIWWSQILAHWKQTPVNNFQDFILRNGVSARGIDLNDLVQVNEFMDIEGFPSQPMYYPSENISFVTRATAVNEIIGCHHFYPSSETDSRFFRQDIGYTVEYWNPARKQWDIFIEEGSRSITPVAATSYVISGGNCWAAEIRFQAPLVGIYRIKITTYILSTMTAPLAFNLVTGEYAHTRNGMTFTKSFSAATNYPTYFYIPKGVTSLDFEEWGGYNASTLTLYNTASPHPTSPHRVIAIGEMGTKRIALAPEESGALAKLEQNGFAFPLFYAIPMIWAKLPSQLLVPRAIAEADGLTILP